MTGGVLNFARTLGPLVSELLTGSFPVTQLLDVLIVYGAGTLIGGALAAVVNSKLFLEK